MMQLLCTMSMNSLFALFKAISKKSNNELITHFRIFIEQLTVRALPSAAAPSALIRFPLRLHRGNNQTFHKVQYASS